jgi:hypothetical protein
MIPKECEYREKRIEHPTAGSCRIMFHCKRYNEYCVNQCGKMTVKKKKKAESK